MSVRNLTLPRDYSVRKISRLPCYDYTQPGAYFVTICTRDKTCLFGAVEFAVMRRNRLGDIVAQEWTNIPRHYEHIRLDEFIVMPNHFHGIIFIEQINDRAFTDKASLVPTSGMFEPDSASLVVASRFGHPGSGSLSSVIGSFKAAVTRNIRRRCSEIAAVWQPRFIEHIIRNDEDLFNHRRYIRDNPARWHPDNENA